MGYAMISHEEPKDLVRVANLLNQAIYRDEKFSTFERDKIWFMTVADGTVILNECVSESRKIDAALKEYTVAIPVIKGAFEWVK